LYLRYPAPAESSWSFTSLNSVGRKSMPIRLRASWKSISESWLKLPRSRLLKMPLVEILLLAAAQAVSLSRIASKLVSSRTSRLPASAIDSKVEYCLL
jgi:hypothetical protein